MEPTEQQASGRMGVQVQAQVLEDQNMIFQVLAELDGQMGGILGVARLPGPDGRHPGLQTRPAAPVARLAAPVARPPSVHPRGRGPPARMPGSEARPQGQAAGAVVTPPASQPEPALPAGAQQEEAAEVAAAEEDTPKGTAGKKGTKRKAKPPKPNVRPRAKLRHSEVGAVPATQEGIEQVPPALGEASPEACVPRGFAKAGKRKPGKLTLADYPNIARRWHPTRNGDSQPGDHRHAGKERVWLLCGGCPVCSERHQWDARVDNLTQYGDNSLCPFCTSKGPSFCSCRSVAKNERLLAEWHEDNPSPTTVALGNDKKHRWRCSDPTCLHVWDASPASRSRAGANCPDCARRRKGTVKHASLAVSCPGLAAEWDEARNGSPATQISCGSKKKGWWLCGVCNSSFQCRVQARALLGSGCPCCRKRLMMGGNVPD